MCVNHLCRLSPDRATAHFDGSVICASLPMIWDWVEEIYNGNSVPIEHKYDVSNPESPARKLLGCSATGWRG